MHPVSPRRFLRRVSTYGTLAALLALVTVSLSQCRMVNVDDSTTSIGTFASREAGQCVADCNKTANDAIRDESRVHVANVRACNGNPTCLQNEEARHTAAVAQIQAARRACVESCHHQGGGLGGR